MVSQQRLRHLRVLVAVTVTALVMSACSSSNMGNAGSKYDNSAKNPTRPAGQVPNGVDGGPADPTTVRAGNPAGELSTDVQPISTFAVDVDTASYTYAARQLAAGTRPAPTSIRPEEFINAFDQGYRQPAGDGFTMSVDGARLPATHRVEGDTSRLLRVGLQTRAESPDERADAALTFIVDVSGSMAEPGKLDLVQSGLNTLADQLRPTDSVALVAYSDQAEVIRPMSPVRDRAALHTAINRLKVAGSTNLEAGLVLGYQTARKGFRAGITNRVVLLSDGLPNVGTTDATPLLREVQEAAAKQISLLGVGVGSDYGDQFMEQLADKGDGFVVYVSDTAQTARVFVEQLPANLAVRALDAKAQVEFDPSTVASYRLIGYEDRAIAESAFRNDRVDGGEVGPGHAVTALYALHLRAHATGKLADVRVRWLDPQTRKATEDSREVTVSALDRQFDTAAPRLRVCYAAAYLGEVLRDSRYAPEVRLADLSAIARAARSSESDQQVNDLVEMTERAARLYG